MKKKPEKKKDMDVLRTELEKAQNVFLTGYEKLTVQQDFELRKALAKALTVYSKANPTFTFKAGMVEGRVIDISGITALATLPSKEEIYAKLLWLINAPAQRLVTVMNGVGRNLAVVVDQGVKENKFSA